MDVLESVRENLLVIDKAAGEFLVKLSMTGVRTDIMLAAEMAGLMLLRQTGVDFDHLRPGAELRGAVGKEAHEMIRQFVLEWAELTRLSEGVEQIVVPGGYKKYRKELGKYEEGLYAACRANGIVREHLPFVAVTTAMKLVGAGRKLNVMSVEEGLGMVLFHVSLGSKTVPWAGD